MTFLIGFYLGGFVCFLLCTACELASTEVKWGRLWWYILWELTVGALMWPIFGIQLWFDKDRDDSDDSTL